MKKYLALCFFIFFGFSCAYSQHRYWVAFAENTSESEFEKSVLQFSNKTGCKPMVVSYWTRSISIETVDIEQIRALYLNQNIKFSKVKSFEILGSHQNINELSIALEQINAEAFIRKGLNGKGVKIGVADVGFEKANQLALTQSLDYVAFKDYVSDTTSNIFSLLQTYLDGHGATVLSNIGGSLESYTAGLATNASYYLARTDHGTKENRIEEDNWVFALEWFHSQGVRLVNSSIGYTDAFDLSTEDYAPTQMDGKTSIAAKAAKIATQEKGMILIVSAGNDGRNSWKVVSTPGDSPYVITVGATDVEGKKAAYSSIGLDAGFVKPDIAVYSKNGTSFSAPVVTGVVACMLQLNPSLTATEVKELLQRSGNMYPYCNNYLGYGIINCERLLLDMEEKYVHVPYHDIESDKGSQIEVLSCPKNVKWASIYHQSKSNQVLKYEQIKVRKGKLKVEKHEDETSTVIVCDDSSKFNLKWH